MVREVIDAASKLVKLPCVELPMARDILAGDVPVAEASLLSCKEKPGEAMLD